jgi:hypothetical protein
MKCPNGHNGGFCCEDNVNQMWASWWEKYKDYDWHRRPLIPVTIDQYEAYKRILEDGSTTG